MTFHVHHIGVAACDVERTLAFYETLFDGRREPLGGQMLVVAGELRVAVVPLRDDDPRGHAAGLHVAVALPTSARQDVEQRLRALGAPHEPARSSLYVRDPDGLTLELVFT